MSAATPTMLRAAEHEASIKAQRDNAEGRADGDKNEQERISKKIVTSANAARDNIAKNKSTETSKPISRPSHHSKQLSRTHLLRTHSFPLHDEIPTGVDNMKSRKCDSLPTHTPAQPPLPPSTRRTIKRTRNNDKHPHHNRSKTPQTDPPKVKKRRDRLPGLTTHTFFPFNHRQVLFLFYISQYVVCILYSRKDRKGIDTKIHQERLWTTPAPTEDL